MVWVKTIPDMAGWPIRTVKVSPFSDSCVLSCGSCGSRNEIHIQHIVLSGLHL